MVLKLSDMLDMLDVSMLQYMYRFVNGDLQQNIFDIA